MVNQITFIQSSRINLLAEAVLARQQPKKKSLRNPSSLLKLDKAISLLLLRIYALGLIKAYYDLNDVYAPELGNQVQLSG